MKIARLTTRLVKRTSNNPLSNPRTTWREKHALLVYLESDDGITGVGEAWCDGLAPATTIAVLENDLAPLVVGADPTLIGALWARLSDLCVVSAKPGLLYAALSAIDIALWDMQGKRTGQPLYRLLGGVRDRVYAYASGGLYGPKKSIDDLAREMADYVAQGFRGVKLKVGGATLEQDVARVRAVRDAIGPSVRLMVDAVYSLDVPSALKLAHAFEPFDVYFLEAPVSPYDIDGLAEVSRRSPIPIAGNEFAYGCAAFRDIIERGQVAYVHLDAILCGGISEAMRIAALVGARHRKASFHSSSSAVCFAANLHVAAAIHPCDSIEFHCVHRLIFDELTAGSFSVVDGHVPLPQGPGLGLEFMESAADGPSP